MADRPVGHLHSYLTRPNLLVTNQDDVTCLYCSDLEATRGEGGGGMERGDMVLVKELNTEWFNCLSKLSMLKCRLE